MILQPKWLGALAIVVSSSALAQNTLGELLDMGAKQIPQAELVSLLSGLTMSGESFNNQGGTIRFDYSGDGTVTGRLRTADGREFPSNGTWKVDDSGKFCRDMTRPNGSKWGDCRYFYRLADCYFAVETNERGTKIEKRVFERR